MKKEVIVFVAMFAGVAIADLSVAWKSQAGAVTLSNGGADYLVGSRIDLIYSTAGAVTASGEYDVNLASETILATGVTGDYSLWNFPGEIFSGDFVGGFFFTRIYETDGSFYEAFLDVPMGSGADWVYNVKDPGTTYSADVVSGVQWVGANMGYMIPEPTTAGLMGVAGVGLLLGRRKARC